MDNILSQLDIEGILVPSVFIALLGLIFQGIKSIIDIVTHLKTRKISKEQRTINLCTALFSLVDASGKTDGEKITIKNDLAELMFKNILDEEVKNTLNLFQK